MVRLEEVPDEEILRQQRASTAAAAAADDDDWEEEDDSDAEVSSNHETQPFCRIDRLTPAICFGTVRLL